MALRIEKLSGNELKTQLNPYIPAIAQLRIEVFREFPHLFDTTQEHEEKYLSVFTQANDFLMIIVFDGDEVIGTTTALPLEQAFRTGNVQQLLLDKGYNPQSLMYFSQSILRKSYRGHGLGVKFFEEREDFTRLLGRFEYACFYGVKRPLDHPKRPSEYIPLDGFWRKRGYTEYPELETTFSWKDLDESVKTTKPMRFWMKELIG